VGGKGGRTQGGNQFKKKKEKNKCQNIDHATQIKRAGSQLIKLIKINKN
jgi:hypothetical protein